MALALLSCALLASGCFIYDRGKDLEPGQIQGRAVFSEGGELVAAKFARVLPEGAGLVRRANEAGAFDVKGLGAGSYVLRLTSDKDGDGVAERGALRAVSLTPYDKDGVTTLPWLLLGDVELAGTGKVTGRVVDGDDPARPPVAGAKVLLLRDASSVPTLLDATAPDAELGAEATTATDSDGVFRIEGLVAGPLKVVAFSGGQSPKVSAPELIEVVADEETAVGDVEIKTPAGTRKVKVGVGFDGPAALVSVFSDGAGADPDLQTPDARSTGGAPADLDLAFGVWDVRGLDDEGGRQGVLLSQVAYPGADDELDWGLMLVREGDPCGQPHGAVRFDIDGDGVRGFPNPADDEQPWRRCAETCATAFGTQAGSPTCESNETLFDCDDDGDLQPDVTEPYPCVGLCGSTDLDGDGICDAADPLPHCAGDDPAAAACDRDDPPDFLPPAIRAEYLTAPVDAGFVDVDAGFVDDAGFDAGLVVPGDAGFVDGGPADAGFTDAGFANDAGFVTDAGFPPDAGPPPPKPWVTAFGDVAFGGQSVAREVIVEGPLVYVAGESGSAATIGIGTTCALSDPPDDTQGFIAILDEDGACLRARTMAPLAPVDQGAVVLVTGMARSAAGLVVVGSTFGEVDFGTTAGGAQLSSGNSNAQMGFVAIYDSILRPTRVISIGDGSNEAYVTAVDALDTGGFAVAGVFLGDVDLGGTTTPLTATGIAYGDLFVGRYDAAGNPAAALQGDAAGDLVEVTALGTVGDGTNSFVVTGRLDTATMFTGAQTIDSLSGVTAFAVRIDGATNALSWVRAMPTSDDAMFHDVALMPGGARIALIGTVAGTMTVPKATGTVNVTSTGSYDALLVFVDPATGFPPLTTDVLLLPGTIIEDYAVAHSATFTGAGDLLVVGEHYGTLNVPTATTPIVLGGVSEDISGHAFAAHMRRNSATGAWTGLETQSTRSFSPAAIQQRLGASISRAVAYGVGALADGSPLLVGQMDGVVGFGDLFRRVEVAPIGGDFMVSAAKAFIWRALPDFTSVRDVEFCSTTCTNSDDRCDPRTGRCVYDCGQFNVSVCDTGDACDARSGLCGEACNSDTICAGSAVCTEVSGTCLPSCLTTAGVCRVGCCASDGQCGDLGTPLAVANDTTSVAGATFTSLTPASTPPAARAHAAFASLPGGGLLFGGLDQTGAAYPDTWLWTGADWTVQDAGMAEPTGFVDVAMGYTTTTFPNGVALVGGRVDRTASAGTNDQRIFSTTAGAWQNDCCNPVFNESLYGAAYAGDIVFGGMDLGILQNRTYQEQQINGLSYGLLSFATSPQPRYGAHMVEDPNTGVIVMYGGIGLYGAALNDTWQLAGVSALTWTEVTANPPSGARTDAMMTWDGGAVLLIGGTDDRGVPRDEVFRYDGPTQGWTLIGTAPVARTGGMIAYDDAADEAILFGGLVEQAEVCATGSSGSPPMGWTCSANAFGDGDCDCGCGVPDADCALPGAGCNDNCEYPTFVSYEPGADTTRCARSACGNQIVDPNELCDDADDLTCDPKTCWRVTPLAWTCDYRVYDVGDGYCDCGCGAFDPDCVDATVASCSVCTGEGSCAQQFNDFCTPIDVFDNSVCGG